MRMIQNLRNDQRGNVLMITGLMLLILFAVAGAGADFGRQQLVRMKLQNASDAAAVAAASMPESTTTEQRRAVALRYYNLNYPTTYLGVARPTANIQIGDQIIVDANTSFSTNFIGGVGVERLESQGRTVVNRTTQAASIYDVILVMDNSNSMSRTTTAPAFISTTSGNRQNAKNLILPFCRNWLEFRLAYDCQGSSPRPVMPNAFIRSPAYSSSAECSSLYRNEYCNQIAEGSNIFVQNADETETVGYSFTGNTRLNALRNVVTNFVSRIIDEGAAGSRISLIRFSNETIFPIALTNDANALRGRIDDMVGLGATNPYVAMQQATSYAQNFNLSHIRAVVFMSDGKPTMTGPLSSSDYKDSTGCNGDEFCQPAVTYTNTLCTQLKNQGVQVYTVGFLDPNDSEFRNNVSDYNRSVAFLRSCASVDGEGNPRYYTAQNGAQLDEAFAQILTSLGRIRISQ